jgi:hypothetical protein
MNEDTAYLWYPEESQQVRNLNGCDTGSGAHHTGDHFADLGFVTVVLRSVYVADGPWNETQTPVVIVWSA